MTTINPLTHQPPEQSRTVTAGRVGGTPTTGQPTQPRPRRPHPLERFMTAPVLATAALLLLSAQVLMWALLPPTVCLIINGVLALLLVAAVGSRRRAARRARTAAGARPRRRLGLPGRGRAAGSGRSGLLGRGGGSAGRGSAGAGAGRAGGSGRGGLLSRLGSRLGRGGRADGRSSGGAAGRPRAGGRLASKLGGMLRRPGRSTAGAAGAGARQPGGARAGGVLGRLRTAAASRRAAKASGSGGGTTRRSRFGGAVRSALGRRRGSDSGSGKGDGRRSWRSRLRLPTRTAKEGGDGNPKPGVMARVARAATHPTSALATPVRKLAGRVRRNRRPSADPSGSPGGGDKPASKPDDTPPAADNTRPASRAFPGPPVSTAGRHAQPNQTVGGNTMVRHEDDASLQRWGRNLTTIAPAVDELVKAAKQQQEVADGLSKAVAKLATQGESALPASPQVVAEAQAIAADLNAAQAEYEAAANRLRNVSGRAGALGASYLRNHETDEARLNGERGGRAKEKRADVTTAERDT